VLQRVLDEGHVATAELAAHLGVSEMTIRRDIQALALDGAVERVIGGARRSGRVGSGFEERAGLGSSLKVALAQAVAPHLTAGTIGLDAGTTVVAVVSVLPPGARVVSHSAPVIAAVADRDDLHLIGVGGLYQRLTKSFVGPTAVAAIADVALDTAVISVTGIDDGWLLVGDPLEAAVKRALISSTRTVIVLADGAKFGVRSAIRLAPIDAIDLLVTDQVGADAVGASPPFDVLVATP